MRNFVLGVLFSGALAGVAGACVSAAVVAPAAWAAAGGGVEAPAAELREEPTMAAVRAPRQREERVAEGRERAQGARKDRRAKAAPPVSDPAPAPPPPQAVAPSAPAPNPSGIVALGDDRYQVPRALIQRYTSDPNALSGQAGASQVDAGWKLSNVKSGSKVQQLGLQSGDVLTSINGYRLDGLTRTWWASQHIKNEDHYNLTIHRGGATKTLRYAVK